MKRYIKLIFLCVCAAVLALIPVAAWQVPTLYVNDEPWYRDELSPLIVRDSVYYIPARMCSALDDIDVEMSGDDSVLICNRRTGEYFSALFSAGKAAVNGEIVRTELFRDGNAYYVDAMLVADSLGLEAECYTLSDGTETLRITDGNSMTPIEIVVHSNRRGDGEDTDVPVKGDDPVSGGAKTIYILCEADSGESYSVCDCLESRGMDFTCFVGAGADDEDIFLAASHGEYGFSVGGDADAADELNERCAELNYSPVRAVLDKTGEDSAALSERGYAALVPDLTVDAGTYAMGAVNEMIYHLGDNDACYVYVTASWSGCEFLRIISGLDSYIFETANISR